MIKRFGTVLFSLTFSLLLHSSMAAAEKPEKQNLPPKGMSMSEVKEQYGKPKGIISAVGNPPISRWVFKNYTVYFEDIYVIHTVKHPITNE